MKENNNIPKGYKKTKLGIIPEDWQVERIDSIFEFINTNSLSRSKLNYDITENSIYNIHYGDIHATFTKPILDLDEENKIPVINTDVDISKFSFLNEGDLIIADASEDYEGVGKAIELKNVKQKKLVAGLHTFALRDISNKTNLGYRAYIFKNTKVSNKLKTIATGSKVYGISKSNLSKFEIVFPPLPEQKEIAKILSTWDKAIENYQLLIDKYKLKKKGLMQKLLTPKNDWKEVRLGEVVSYLGGGAFKSNDQTEEGIKWLKIANVGVTKTKWDIKTYLPFNFKEDFSQYLLLSGDIVLALTRPILNNQLKIAIIKDDDISLLNQRVAKIIPKRNINGLFIYYAHQLPIVVYLMNAMMAGTDPPNIGLKDLGSIKISIPNLQTQTKIANILSSADKEISILEQQLSKLKEQKKGLMQVLLTGKKRVKQMDN